MRSNRFPSVLGHGAKRPICRLLDDTSFDKFHSRFPELPVLPDQHDITAEQRLAFGRRFGTLSTSLKAETELDRQPEILVLSIMKQGGKHVGALQRGNFWHIELFLGRLLSVTRILCAEIVAEGDGPDVGD